MPRFAALPEQDIKNLVDDIRRGRCVLFAGSGLSAWAKLPRWTELLLKLVAETPETGKTRSELKKLVRHGKLLEVGEYCKAALNDQRFAQILGANLTLGKQEPIPVPHKLLSSIPFAAVITTNYDQLLESAFAAADGGRLPKILTHRDITSMGPLLFDGGFFIIKAHGDITRPETLILSARDYQRLLYDGAAFASIFSAILLTKRILFVGYSLSDPDFKMIIDRQFSAFRGNLPEHFALMTGVGSVEQNVLARTANIRVLDYSGRDKFEDLVPFLEELAGEVNRGSSAKKSRPVTSAVPKPLSQRRKLAVANLRLRLRGDRLFATIQTLKNQELVMSLQVALPNLLQISKLLETEPVNRGIPISKYQRAGQSLTACLPALVVKQLENIPLNTTIILHLSPELEQFPWEWVETNNEFLLLRHPIIRAPIDVTDRARGYAAAQPPVHILVIGDPESDLRFARKEAQDIKQMYASKAEVVTLIGREATVDNVSNAISSKEFDIIHYAGDGWFDAQESYLRLAGESALRASELRSLVSPRPPAILILNSHYTAFLPAGLQNPRHALKKGPRDEPHVAGRRGFTRVAVASGVGAFVGCFGNPSDGIGRIFGRQLHHELARGKSIAHAVHIARQVAAVAGKKIGDASWMLYTMTGYPELALDFRRK